MKKSELTVTILAGLIAFSANANSETATPSSSSYQHEVNLTLGTHTDDFGDGLWNLDYRYYFHPVNVDNGPYALNGFLAQESNIGAQYAQLSTVTDTASYSVDGTYVLDSSWFIGANYNKVDLDSGNDLVATLEDDISEYGISLGYYFNDTSEVSFSYQTSSTSGDSSFDSSYYTHTMSSESDSKSYTAQIHSFIPLKSFSGLDLLASWSYIDSDYKYIDTATNEVDNIVYKNSSQVDTNQVTLAADWYITKSWSVGANYLWSQYDMKGEYVTPERILELSFDDSNSYYSLSTSYWWQISQSFAANFSAAKQFGLDGDNTPDGLLIGITANARF